MERSIIRLGKSWCYIWCWTPFLSSKILFFFKERKMNENPKRDRFFFIFKRWYFIQKIWYTAQLISLMITIISLLFFFFLFFRSQITTSISLTSTLTPLACFQINIDKMILSYKMKMPLGHVWKTWHFLNDLINTWILLCILKTNERWFTFKMLRFWIF